jgi:hypothetical protein
VTKGLIAVMVAEMPSEPSSSAIALGNPMKR